MTPAKKTEHTKKRQEKGSQTLADQLAKIQKQVAALTEAQSQMVAAVKAAVATNNTSDDDSDPILAAAGLTFEGLAEACRKKQKK